MPEQELEITIHVDDDVTADYLLAELPKYGLQTAPPDEFGELELTLVAAVVIMGLANGLALIIMSILGRVQGGTVVDLTGERPDVRGDRDVPRGWMIILTKDGQVELKTEDLPPDALERVATKFLEIGKDATVATIQATVKAVQIATGHTGAAEE